MLSAARPASSPVDVGLVVYRPPGCLRALSTGHRAARPPHKLAGMPRRIDARERRNRLAHRHRLAPQAKAGTVEEVAAALVALHATDPATVHLAAGARLTEPSVAAVERALYDDRTLLRMLGMRRTMFVVPRASVPVIQAACTDAVAAQQRRLLVQHLTEAGVADDPAGWLVEVGDATVRARCGRGRPRRGYRTAARRRRRAGTPGGALDRAAARARPDGDGLDQPRLVPRPARRRPVRPHRKRRPDGVVRRSRRRRLGAERLRRGALPAAGGRRPRRRRPGRARGRAADRVARPGPGHPAVPHAAGA